jgi:hypothetical protein
MPKVSVSGQYEKPETEMGGIPNLDLDQMSQEELRSFSQRWRLPSYEEAVKLLGEDRKDARRIVMLLASYASDRCSALRLKASGDEAQAALYDQACNMAYHQLPQSFRW